MYPEYEFCSRAVDQNSIMDGKQVTYKEPSLLKTKWNSTYTDANWEGEKDEGDAGDVNDDGLREVLESNGFPKLKWLYNYFGKKFYR